jgi:DNA-binding response OmpR family regulator
MPDPAPQQQKDVQLLSLGALVIDARAWQAHLNGEMVRLTRLELKVLAHLAQNAGRVVTKDELLLWVWRCSPEGKGTNNVDSCMKRLRRKLGGWGQEHLSTVRGVGYRLEAE